MLLFPPFRLDSSQERLWKGDQELSLRRKPFAILRYLASHPKKLVTHQELLEQVWRGAVVSDSSMRSHLHELRQVLGDGVIETVIGRGYRFIAEVREDVVLSSDTSAVRVDPLVVGRDEQLGMLRSALDLVRSGQRQVCFVTGKPGIGKTTLVRTFLGGLDARVVHLAQGCCFEQHGTPEPFLAIIEALAALVRSPRGATVLATLLRHAPTFVARVPQLASDEQLEEVTRRAAGSNEARQLRELSEAVEALCVQEPLVLVLEDLQWSDVATIDLLARLGQRRERAKLLVIVTVRHAEVQSQNHPLNPVLRLLVARHGALWLQLPKIDLAAVHSFVDQRFPGHAFPAELAELVLKITGGTPLFMVALLDELCGRGMLVQRDGRWTLTVSVAEVQAHRPASVKQLIDMQLDRFSSTEQRVLEAASIVGTEFAPHLVAAALEVTVEEVDDTCDSLVRRSLFIHREPSGRYGVNHALVQQVCYERTSPARRQRWHRLVAEALQRDSRAGELSNLLAQHFDAAGDAERAVPAYLAAGQHAAQRYATSDTIALCTRAIDLIGRLSVGRHRDELEFQALVTMCKQVSSNSFRATFAGRQPLAVYARAIELARTLDDASRLYAAITQLCNYHMITAQYDACANLFVELEQIEATQQIDAVLLHAGIFARGFTALFSGNPQLAVRLFERLVPANDEESVFKHDLAGRTLALGHLACARWASGEPERALEEALTTLKLADEINIPILQGLAHVVRARVRYLRRDPLPVVEEEAIHAVRAASLDLGLLMEANAFSLLAEAQRAPLKLEAVRPALDALRLRMTEVATCSTLIGLVLVDVLRVSGHAAEARALTDEMIAFAVRNERVFLPELLLMRGDLSAATGSETAKQDYRAALELAQSLGTRSSEMRATDRLSTRATRKR
jgi:DNA-binding winged helix-turn-helix (wHTH) protein